MKILSLITGLLLSSSVLNAAGFADLNVVQNCIKNTQHSPHLGFAARNKNTLDNLRLNGHFDYAAQRKDDKPQNAVAYLLKHFFPSPAGNLQANNINNQKFLKYFTPQKFLKYFTPQAAARLLGAIKEYKKCLVNFVNDIKANLDPNFWHSEKRIQQKLTEFHNGFLKRIDGQWKKQASPFKGPVDTNFKKQLALAIEEMMLPPLEQRNHASSYLNVSKQSLYPDNILEQIILGFFLEKTSSKEDLATFTEELGKYNLESLDQKKDSSKLYTRETLEEDLKALQQGRYDLNTLANLINIRHGYDYFKNPLPSLVGGGVSSQCYQRVKNQDGDIVSQPFKDQTCSPCVENSLRDFINLLTFNPGTRQFDLSALEKNLKKYYPDPQNYPQPLKDLEVNISNLKTTSKETRKAKS